MRRLPQLPSWALALVLSFGFVAALVLGQSLLRTGVSIYLGGAALLILVLSALAPSRPPSALGPAPLSSLGAWLGIGSAVFFRTRYLWTVPAGYGFEPLTFVFFARRLYLEGFPYIPYAWYAHTLYSYAIAAVLPFESNELIAARIASVIISVLTVLMLYVCGRWLFGRQVAWIAVALLAPSWWHLFASRNSYHQLLMPPFQLLLVGGAVIALRDRKWWGFYVAGVGLIGALHAYWGLYLLLPYTGLLAVYVLLWHRDTLRGRVGQLLLAASVTLLGLVPLGVFFSRNLHEFGYTTRAFSPRMSDAPDLLSKLASNGNYVLWALSGHPRAQVPYGSVVDPLVAAAALVGLALSLRWWRVSMAHAALVLLLAINVAGLLATMANYFYVTATMAAVYLLAAVGLGETLGAAVAALPRLRFVLALAVMALIGWRSVEGYATFFHQRVLTDLQSPFRPIGRAYQILDTVDGLLPSSSVFVSRDEPGRDFSDEIFELGKRIPSCGFMQRVQAIDAATVLFSAQQLKHGCKAELIVPNEEYVDRRLVPLLRQLYPGLTVTPQLAPEPFDSFERGPIAIRITIPWADLEKRFGLSNQIAGGDAEGMFQAPSDGEYRFRSLPTIFIDGRSVNDGQPILLERGLHRFRVSGWNALNSGVEYALGESGWISIDDLLVNAAGVPESVWTPYLARPGRFADFFFDFYQRLEVGHTIRDAPVDDRGNVAATFIDAVRMVGPLGQPVWQTPLPGPRDYRSVFRSGELLAVDPGGAVAAVSATGAPVLSHSGCGAVDVAVWGGQLVVLCGNSRVVFPGSTTPEFALHGPDDRPLMRPVAIRSRGETLLVIDALTSQVLSYDRSGRLVDSWAVPNLWGDSELAVDATGNLYVRRWLHGWRAYGPDGALLFHPQIKRPLVFSRRGESMANLGWRRLHTSASHATLVSPDGFIEIYERRTVAPPNQDG